MSGRQSLAANPGRSRRTPQGKEGRKPAAPARPPPPSSPHPRRAQSIRESRSGLELLSKRRRIYASFLELPPPKSNSDWPAGRPREDRGVIWPILARTGNQRRRRIKGRVRGARHSAAIQRKYREEERGSRQQSQLARGRNRTPLGPPSSFPPLVSFPPGRSCVLFSHSICKVFRARFFPPDLLVDRLSGFHTNTLFRLWCQNMRGCTTLEEYDSAYDRQR